MESQIADKDQLTSRLEKQRNRLEKEKEDEVSHVNCNKEQIDVKVEALNKQIEEKDVRYRINIVGEHPKISHRKC